MRKVIPWSMLEEYGACMNRIEALKESWDAGIPFTKAALGPLLHNNGVFTWQDVEWIVYTACTREACSEWYEKTKETFREITKRDIDLTWSVLTNRLGVKDWWRRQVLDYKPAKKGGKDGRT